MRFLVIAALLALCLTSFAADPPPPKADKDHDKDAGTAEGGVAPPPCSVEALTRNCELFDPVKAGPRIALPDGTYIPNFAFNRKEHHKPKGGEETDEDRRERELDEADEAALEVTEKLTKLLNGLGARKAAFKFVSAITNLHASPSPFSEIWDRWVKSVNPEDDERLIRLPFPPDKPKVGAVPYKEVREWLDANLGKHKKAVAGWLDKARAKFEKARDPESNDDDRKAREVTGARADHVDGLFKTARKKVISLFENRLAAAKGKKEKTYLKNAIAKLEKLSFRAHDNPAVKSDQMCSSPIPNAWYDPLTLTVSMCGGFYNYPDATIINVLGHEIGHAVDPCHNQCPVCSVNRKKIDDFLMKKMGTDKKPMLTEDEESLLGEVSLTIEGGSKYQSLPLALDHDKATLDQFKDAGILSTETDGTPFENYPLKDVYDCLISKKGGGFRPATDEEMKRVAAEVAEARAAKRLGTTSSEKKKAEADAIYSALTRFRECVGIDRHSHMGEAMADWVGSKVLGSYLEDEAKKGKRLDTPAKQLGTVGFFASLLCMGHYQEKKSGKKTTDIVRQVLEQYRALADPHPGDKSRLESIILRDPAVRKALGCKPGDEACGEKWKVGT